MAREQETLLDPGRGASSTHERVKSPNDVEPTSEVIPLTTVPPPGKDADKYIGCTIDGRYIVESVLGEGGMGIVYKCRRRVFEKTVAVKILRSDLAKNQEAIDRFVTEAKAASAIGNPHIVDIFDFGELPDGSTYSAMEYLEGNTLGALSAAGVLKGSPRVVPIGRQIADGLAAAHASHIVHRDLKPDNVFITQRAGRDFVKILDFGIAKVAGSHNRITRAGAVFGTPHYMSPEQCKGTAVDHRTDVYSLGVILYETMTGRVPFDAENPLSILSMHLNDVPQRFDEFTPPIEAPPGLEKLILKCMAKGPEERFQSMTEVSEALAAIERGEPVEIVVPISVAPPPGVELPKVELPPTSSAPLVSPTPSAAPVVPSSSPVFSHDVDEPSYIADVRASQPEIDAPPPVSGPASGPHSSPHSAPRSAPHAAPPPMPQPAALPAPVSAPSARVAQLESTPDWTAEKKRPKWLIPAAIAVIAAIGIGVAANLGAGDVRGTLGEAVQVGRPLVFTETIRKPAPVVPTGPKVKVSLVLSPIDAHVWVAGKDLGTMPIVVEVEKGKPLEVEVRRDHWWTRKLTLDGSKTKETVRLAPIRGGKAPPPGASSEPLPPGVGEFPAPPPGPTFKIGEPAEPPE